MELTEQQIEEIADRVKEKLLENLTNDDFVSDLGTRVRRRLMLTREYKTKDVDAHIIMGIQMLAAEIAADAVIYTLEDMANRGKE